MYIYHGSKCLIKNVQADPLRTLPINAGAGRTAHRLFRTINPILTSPSAKASK
jgi:hypothetical protein